MDESPRATARPEFRRVEGRHDAGRPGPLLIVVGGMHGNEPSGVYAGRRVLEELRAQAPRFAGRLVVLCGNVRALDAGERFLEHDLNRLWLDPEPGAAGGGEAVAGSEARERRELEAALLAEIGPEERVVLLDLHSTSAPGAPFAILADTLQNRDVALSLHIPVLLGLEENVPGTLLEWMAVRGHVAVCVEGGQHEDGATVEHHEVAIWTTMMHLGMVDASAAPETERRRRELGARCAALPPVIEIHTRHGIAPGEEFEMVGVFGNFDRVHAGQLVAREGPGLEHEVRVRQEALLVMPRYQGKGNDGFFLGRAVRPFWLKLSAGLRRLRLERVLAALPGVESRGAGGATLIVNRRVARWFATDLMHLLGYRRSSPVGRTMVFTRRVEGSFLSRSRQG